MSYDDFDYDRDGGPVRDRCDCPDVWTQLFGDPGPPVTGRDYIVVGLIVLVALVVVALLVLVLAPVLAA